MARTSDLKSEVVAIQDWKEESFFLPIKAARTHQPIPHALLPQ
jgi:hypothetical protein